MGYASHATVPLEPLSKIAGPNVLFLAVDRHLKVLKTTTSLAGSSEGFYTACTRPTRAFHYFFAGPPLRPLQKARRLELLACSKPASNFTSRQAVPCARDVVADIRR